MDGGNNRIVGFTGSGLYLNDNGINITIDQNDVDGTANLIDHNQTGVNLGRLAWGDGPTVSRATAL